MNNTQVLEGYKPKGKARIAFKKARIYTGLGDSDLAMYGMNHTSVVIVLEIPATALVNEGTKDSWARRTKKRASEAFVLGFVHPTTGQIIATPAGSVRSAHCRSFVYRVGETVRPQSRFSRSTEECASGIHFFDTFREAAEYPN